MTPTKLDQIKPYEKNAKKHPKKQIKQIANSIREFGFNQPIVVDGKGVIIVGHGRYEAAKVLGLTEVPVIVVKNLSAEKTKAYRLADNKLNESDWDMEMVIQELKELNAEGYDIDITGFDRDFLLEDDGKDDDVPLSAPKRAKLGDLWQLGTHRVLCGDATSEEDFSRLMGGGTAQMVFTDPPYNVDYQGGMGERKKNTRSPLKNDKMSKEAFYEFLAKACTNMHKSVKGAEYICMSSSEIDTLKRAFTATGGHWQTFCVWVKNHFTLSRSDYQNTSEMILYGWPVGIKNHYFIEDRTAANVWEDLSAVKTEFDGKVTTISFHGFKVRIEGKVEKGAVIRKKQRTDIWRYDKPSRSEEHPTMKPVALCLEGIINSSQRGEIVLDPFLGSGSTLIACEKAGRIAFGCEIDERYVDVILTRWELYTGKTAKLIDAVDKSRLLDNVLSVGATSGRQKISKKGSKSIAQKDVGVSGRK
jgi:DNA modification methylase